MRVSRDGGDRGIVLPMTALILIMAVPLIGLAIDGTLLYIVKARLQGAADGAALAAARALARGSNDSAQTTSAKDAAVAYVKINFPNNYFFSNSLSISQSDVDVDLSVAFQRTVTVRASVVEPTFLLRYIAAGAVSGGATTVRASAQTVRRDVNIAMVVDRSGSLQSSGSCGAVRQASINFANKFAETRDNLSLVTFASSTHTDYQMGNTFLTGTPNMITTLNNMTCAGSTSTAMGLWYGYDQLVSLHQPAALNVILLFTDGQPTGVYVKMPLASSSPCLSPNAGTPNWISGIYNTYANSNQFFGLLAPTNSGTVTNNDQNITPDGNSGQGCRFASNYNDTSDFQGVPTTDLFGDRLDNGYTAINYSGSYINLSDTNNAPNMNINAADDAARRIRIGTTVPAVLPQSGSSLDNIIVYTIGLGNSGIPASPGLLRRMANDPEADNYDSTRPAGAYVAAPTSADIDEAFSKVASEILRLAR